MHKISKIKDAIKPDLTVSMKAAKIEKQRVKILKPQLLSEKKFKEKIKVQLKKYSKMLMLIMM